MYLKFFINYCFSRPYFTTLWRNQTYSLLTICNNCCTNNLVFYPCSVLSLQLDFDWKSNLKQLTLPYSNSSLLEHKTSSTFMIYSNLKLKSWIPDWLFGTVLRQTECTENWLVHFVNYYNSTNSIQNTSFLNFYLWW